MAPTPEELEQHDFRQRVRDQVAMIRAAYGGDVASDLPDDADHSYLFVPGRVLVATADVDRLTGVVNDNLALFEAATTVVRQVSSLSVVEFPAFRSPDRDAADFLRGLRLLDAELGSRVVTPDHYLHASPIGGGRPCPATEPEETGEGMPWPPPTEDLGAGDGIRVSIVDTGGPMPDPPGVVLDPSTELLADPLAEYSGHGTFIEGVVRCRAPKADIRHWKFLVQGGAIQESEMLDRLDGALATEDADQPHVINLSAGGHTRDGFELKSLQALWDDRLSGLRETVLVCAAGNDGTDDPFYPAAFDWAVGVGSLDRNGQVSSFSNYGRSADVFVVGRNHINAYPRGRYVCKESPDKGDQRNFTNGLARWSGTSFSSPLVAGMIAARATADGVSIREATQRVLHDTVGTHDATHGPIRLIDQSRFVPGP